MKRNNYIKYYRVFKNGTTVTEISANDFIPVVSRHFEGGLPAIRPVDVLCSFPRIEYSLPPDDQMFYGYLDKARAMEKARTGARFRFTS